MDGWCEMRRWVASRGLRGLMDKASDFGSEDCGFESRRGRLLIPPSWSPVSPQCVPPTSTTANYLSPSTPQPQHSPHTHSTLHDQHIADVAGVVRPHPSNRRLSPAPPAEDITHSCIISCTQSHTHTHTRTHTMHLTPLHQSVFL